MDPVKGAGLRLKNDLQYSQVHFVQSKKVFRSLQNQEYFLTTQNRIMRYDIAINQYNVYYPSKQEFVPCAGLREGEAILEVPDPELLHELLIGQRAWSDYLLEKGSKFTSAAGKQALFGMTMGLTAGFIAPVVGRGLQGAFAALKQPAAQLADSVGRIPEAIAPHLPHVGNHAHHMAVPIDTAIAGHHHGIGCLHSNGHGVGDVLGHGAGGIGHGHIPPINMDDPNIDLPFVPQNNGTSPWVTGLFGAGGTMTGALVGGIFGGPIGALIGSIFGAGGGALVGS